MFAATVFIPVELLEQRATAPHWGSKVLGEAVEAARAALGEQQAAVPGLGALADTLQQAQWSLSDAAAQLSALPDQASGADLSAAQEQVASQLQRVSAAAQAAAAALQGLPGPGDVATSMASQLPGEMSSLAAAQFGGYSLQTLAAVTSGVAALVALSVPRSDDEDGPPGSGGSGGSGGGTGPSSRASSSGGPDVLPSSWDAEAVAAYYRRRPVEVARRVAQVASEAAAYGAALLADMAAGGRGGRAAQGLYSWCSMVCSSCRDEAVVHVQRMSHRLWHSLLCGSPSSGCLPHRRHRGRQRAAARGPGHGGH